MRRKISKAALKRLEKQIRAVWWRPVHASYRAGFPAAVDKVERDERTVGEPVVVRYHCGSQCLWDAPRAFMATYVPIRMEDHEDAAITAAAALAQIIGSTEEAPHD